MSYTICEGRNELINLLRLFSTELNLTHHISDTFSKVFCVSLFEMNIFATSGKSKHWEVKYLMFVLQNSQNIEACVLVLCEHLCKLTNFFSQSLHLLV